MRKLLRKILTVFLAGLFLLALGAPVFAGNQGGTFTLDPFTGFYSFDRDQNLDARSYHGLRAGYNLTDSFAFEGMVGFVPTETRSLAPVDRDVQVYRAGIDALLHFNPSATLVPFISAGVAVTQTDNGSDGMPDHGRGMFNYGVGLKYFLSDTVALRGDVKQSLFSEGGANRSNVEYTVGLTFLLGAEKKAVAGTRDTTAPEVVCTSPDSGVTGVAIDRSITAIFSEEMDRSTITTATFTLKKGTTPVSGRVTYAGTTATFNPASSLEPGTTYTAAVATGVKDRAGNAMKRNYEWRFTTVLAPEQKPVLILLEDTHFEFDKSEITRPGMAILDENIKILKASPKVRIRIAGYTSAKGTEDYNQKLSERRAVAVKDYLVKGGIASDRLVTIGFGQTRPAEYEPLPDNIYSKEAKANMRVLFEVIVK